MRSEDVEGRSANRVSRVSFSHILLHFTIGSSPLSDLGRQGEAIFSNIYYLLRSEERTGEERRRDTLTPRLDWR